jgi:PTS system nitrogen regulatory IIA component
MKLSDLLSQDLVLCPMESEDKWQAIRTLAATAVGAGRIDKSMSSAVEAALVSREKSMTTGMEKGIAIPHAAVDGIEDVVAVLGLSPAGIPFETLDGNPAQIIVCLVIPRAKKLLHIKTLAEIARLLSRAEVREGLLLCNSPSDVLAALVELEDS